MQKKSKSLLFTLVLLGVFGAAMVTATLYDWPIDVALYNPTNPFGIFMEAFGWFPAFFAPAMLAALLATLHKGEGLPAFARPIGAVGLLGLCLVLGYASQHYLQKRGWVPAWVSLPCLLWFLFVVVLFAVLFYFVAAAKPATRTKLWFFAISGSALSVSELAVAQLLKMLWGRARFDDIIAATGITAAPPALFSPWYLPFGGGGSSFPSAHTANAACIVLVLLWCDICPRLAKKRGLLYVLCGLYTGAMAVSRLIMGRHFLSDTVVGFALTICLFCLLRSSKLYRRSLTALLNGSLSLFNIKKREVNT